MSTRLTQFCGQQGLRKVSVPWRQFRSPVVGRAAGDDAATDRHASKVRQEHAVTGTYRERIDAISEDDFAVTGRYRISDAEHLRYWDSTSVHPFHLPEKKKSKGVYVEHSC
jgi:hypothetical protein